jgi:hypothetical protein
VLYSYLTKKKELYDGERIERTVCVYTLRHGRINSFQMRREDSLLACRDQLGDENSNFFFFQQNQNSLNMFQLVKCQQFKSKKEEKIRQTVR